MALSQCNPTYAVICFYVSYGNLVKFCHFSVGLPFCLSGTSEFFSKKPFLQLQPKLTQQLFVDRSWWSVFYGSLRVGTLRVGLTSRHLQQHLAMSSRAGGPSVPAGRPGLRWMPDVTSRSEGRCLLPSIGTSQRRASFAAQSASCRCAWQAGFPAPAGCRGQPQPCWGTSCSDVQSRSPPRSAGY